MNERMWAQDHHEWTSKRHLRRIPATHSNRPFRLKKGTISLACCNTSWEKNVSFLQLSRHEVGRTALPAVCSAHASTHSFRSAMNIWVMPLCGHSLKISSLSETVPGEKRRKVSLGHTSCRTYGVRVPTASVGKSLPLTRQASGTRKGADRPMTTGSPTREVAWAGGYAKNAVAQPSGWQEAATVPAKN